tara:strand:- start:156 stop:401 length:246 start_codon:yes stop_codon:yes gene_type:complete
MSDENKTNDYLIEYFKAFQAVELEMEPYKEHKKDLKKNYVENGWLTKQEISQGLRAYRMLKKGENIEDFSDIFEKLQKQIS